MFVWIMIILVIIWGVSTINELKNAGAFEAILGTIIWLIMGGGAVFVLLALLF